MTTMSQPTRATIPTWDLADRLNKSLRHAEVSVQEMADFLQVHRNTISGWLNARGKEPARAMLVSWAVATNVDYEWLRSGAEPEDDGPTNGDAANGTGNVTYLRLPKAGPNQQPTGC